MDTLEQRWSQYGHIRDYARGREIDGKASGLVVRDVFSRYVEEEDQILEVGSGYGELVHHAPAYADRIQQTDVSPRVVKEHMQAHTHSNIRQASVYDLPFGDSSFNVVVGYSSFDTFADLERAFREIKRVLRLNGRVIHFLDRTANVEAVVHRYKSDDVVLFPYARAGQRVTGIQIVQRSDFEQIGGDKALYEYCEYFPEVLMDFRRFSDHCDAEGSEAGIELSRIVQSWPFGKKAVEWTQAFINDMTTSLGKKGFEIVENQERVGKSITIPKPDHSDSRANTIDSYLGSFLGSNNPELELPDDQVQVFSHLWVTVARV